MATVYITLPSTYPDKYMLTESPSVYYGSSQGLVYSIWLMRITIIAYWLFWQHL